MTSAQLARNQAMSGVLERKYTERVNLRKLLSQVDYTAIAMRSCCLYVESTMCRIGRLQAGAGYRYMIERCTKRQ